MDKTSWTIIITFFVIMFIIFGVLFTSISSNNHRSKISDIERWTYMHLTSSEEQSKTYKKASVCYEIHKSDELKYPEKCNSFIEKTHNDLLKKDNQKIIDKYRELFDEELELK